MSSVSNKLDSKDWDKIIKEINASIASGEFYKDDEMTDEEYIEEAAEFGYFQEDEDFDDELNNAFDDADIPAADEDF